MLIPFDLEKALSGAKLVIRDGSPVDEFHYFHSVPNIKQRVYAVSGGHIQAYGIDGYFFDQEEHAGRTSAWDLMLKVEPKKYYMNAYIDDFGRTRFGNICETPEECETSKLPDYSSSKFLKLVEIDLSQP